MTTLDLRICAAHALFWLMFAAGDRVARFRGTSDRSTSSSTPVRAPRAGLLLAVHMTAFMLMDVGIGQEYRSRTRRFIPGLY